MDARKRGVLTPKTFNPLKREKIPKSITEVVGFSAPFQPPIRDQIPKSITRSGWMKPVCSTTTLGPGRVVLMEAVTALQLPSPANGLQASGGAGRNQAEPPAARPFFFFVVCTQWFSDFGKTGRTLFGAWTILVGQPPKKGNREPLNN